VQDYGLSASDAQLLTQEQEDLADYFEAAVAEQVQPKEVCNWMLTEMQRELKERNVRAREVQFRPWQLAGLIRLIAEGSISNTIGKQIFPDLFASGQDPEKYVQVKNLTQISDQDQLDQVVDLVLEENPNEVQAYLGGKTKLISFFMGQVMKKTKGQANPKMVNSLISSKLESFKTSP
jgi:aspartyl-tRNA(Asn)/glutamyl-tRNA(Gln) amidotransferase subunit B